MMKKYESPLCSIVEVKLISHLLLTSQEPEPVISGEGEPDVKAFNFWDDEE